MTRLLARLTATSVALVACALAPAAASAASPGAVGLQVRSISATTDLAALDRELDVAKTARVKLVRLEIPWSAIEPTAPSERDPAALAAADHAMAAAAQRNLKVVLVIDSTPCWASAAPDSVRGDCGSQTSGLATTYPPRNPSDFVAIATFLASRYASRLAAFEVWNEPDQANQRYFAGPDKAARYAALVRAVYQPLKRAAPKVTVLAGAFVGYNGSFLRALYAEHIRGYYDALSVHFYDLTLWGVRGIRAVQLAHKDTKPIWVAESGWTSCRPAKTADGGHRCVSRAAQAQFLADLVSTAFKRSYLKAVVLYDAQDDGGDYAFGLVDSSFGPKPALAAVRQALGPKPPPVRPIVLRLRRSGSSVSASGSAPAGDVYELTVRVRGRLLYVKRFGLDIDGRYNVRLPTAVGSHGLSVSLTAPWIRKRVTRTI